MGQVTDPNTRVPTKITTVTTQFSGPIPPPALLQQYDAIVPGAAERIIQMAERQSAHRMELESKVISSDIRKSERGQIFGLLVAVGGLVAASVLGATGHEAIAGIVAGVDLVSLTAVFVIGRHKKEQERLKNKQI